MGLPPGIKAESPGIQPQCLFFPATIVKKRSKNKKGINTNNLTFNTVNPHSVSHGLLI
jgi:hypothetical protein